MPTFAALRASAAGVPVYPVVLSLAFLVVELIEFWVPATGLVRAGVVLVGITLLLQLGFSAVAGRDRGAYIAAILVMSAFDLRIVVLILLAAFLPVLYRSVKTRRLMKVDWSLVTRVVNVVAVLSLVVSVASAARTGFDAVVASEVIPARPAPSTGTAPDIYLILLDGYARVDTLEETLGYDNRPFLAEMEGLGFDVAADSHSNYQRTVLTLTSMLNGRHVNDLMPSPPDGYIRQNAQLSSWMREPTAVNVARALGYEFDLIPTERIFVTPSAPDRLLDSGYLNEFEYLMPRVGLLGIVAPGAQEEWFRDQHRRRILDAFATLTSLAGERGGRPKLVLGHVMTPHQPIVFRRDGSLATVPECYWSDCDLDDPLVPPVRDGLGEQVAYTNELVRRTVESIIATSSRPPVIVVFGDHGFRHWLSDKPETFQNLFMSYTPGHPALFPENTTLVNVLPRILNAYVDAGLPLASEDSWADAELNGYFPLVPWPATN